MFDTERISREEAYELMQNAYFEYADTGELVGQEVSNGTIYEPEEDDLIRFGSIEDQSEAEEYAYEILNSGN